MAARNKELEKISTTKILEELRKANDDTSEFFYLYVSTSGTEHKRQNRRKLPPDQKTLDTYVVEEDSDSSEDEEDDAQMECDDDVDTIENTSQSATPPADNNSSLLPSGSKKVREATMDLVHKHVRQEVLYPDGWKKVCDKDRTTTYRALYFNIIKRRPNELQDHKAYLSRVIKVRQTISKEANKIKAEHRVNFKTNILLSKPFLYDEPTLEEQSMSQGSTQRGRQTTLYEYANKKT